MPEKISAEAIIKNFDKLDSDRSNYHSLWQKLAKYCIPRKAYITKERHAGEKYAFDVYDSTAIQSSLVLAAGLHSYLTNPASKWFVLKTQDRKFMDDQSVKMWLKEAEDKIYDVLNSSNFAQMIHETYLDLSIFGTSGLYEEEDPTDIVRFFSWPIGDIFIEEDDRGRVITVYRRFKLTARQAQLKWGDKAGEAVKKALDNKNEQKKIEFIQCVTPRYERTAGTDDAQNMPYASYYVEREKKQLISEGGYLEFPFFVPRFNKHNDDPYGSSPGMVSLPDILQLNKMDETIIRAAQIKIDPPLSVPHGGYMLPIKWKPRAVNYRTSKDPKDNITPIITGVDIPVGLEMEDRRRTIIKQNFFVDLFLLLAQKERMTATEVMQRVEEKMLILAPTLGRLMSELLDPIITRTLNILIRGGHIPPPPESIAGKDYVVEYTSPLARAQRFEEMKSINNAMTVIGNIAGMLPYVLDKINGDKVVDQIADLYNLSPDFINDDNTIKEIREGREEMQQMQAELEAAKTGAGAMKDASQAKKNAEPEAK